MKKSIFILGLLLLLISCEQKPIDCLASETAQKQDAAPVATEGCTPGETPSDPATPVDDPIEAPPVVGEEEDVPAEALLFDVDANLTYFDNNDETKVLRAFAIIKKVVATKEFKDRVLNFSYGANKTFVDNDGLTNTEIYQKLLDGSEELVPGIDHQMDLDLELYYSNRSTVGYTYADGMRIWMNTKFFDIYTPSEVAGNVFHEWTHKLGFSHASSYSVSRDSSVPYALGYLIEELGKKYE